MIEEKRYFDDLIQARDKAQKALEAAVAEKFPVGTWVEYWCYEHSARELVVGVQGENVFVMTNDMSRLPDKRHFNMLRLATETR